MNYDAPTDGYYEPPEPAPGCLDCKYCKAADCWEEFWYCTKQQAELRSDKSCKTDLDIFNSFYCAQKEDDDPICDDFEWGTNE